MESPIRPNIIFAPAVRALHKTRYKMLLPQQKVRNSSGVSDPPKQHTWGRIKREEKWKKRLSLPNPKDDEYTTILWRIILSKKSIPIHFEWYFRPGLSRLPQQQQRVSPSPRRRRAPIFMWTAAPLSRPISPSPSRTPAPAPTPTPPFYPRTAPHPHEY